MNLIVAVDNQYGIGKDGGLLTHLPKDLKHFKALTNGKILVMGRKTVESLPGGKLLPNRTTWILSRDKNYHKEGATTFSSIEEIVAFISENKINTDDIFVAGGAAIYNAFLPIVDIAYITKIAYDFQADVHMDNVDVLPYLYLNHISEKQTHKELDYYFTSYKKN